MAPQNAQHLITEAKYNTSCNGENYPEFANIEINVTNNIGTLTLTM